MCVYGFTDNCVVLQLFCFTGGGALVFAGSSSSSVEHVLLYLQPFRGFFFLFFLIQIWMHLSSCCHKCVCSSRERHRGHFVLQQNGHGPFCVRTNQWKDEPASSEDGHEMP